MNPEILRVNNKVETMDKDFDDQISNLGLPSTTILWPKFC